MRIYRAAVLLVILSLLNVGAGSVPIPPGFESVGNDRKAIDALLGNYTKAVSSKDQALFETLLLNKQTTFSDVSSAIAAKEAAHYDSFRKGVFDGPAFTQRFQDIHVAQDGPLADVSLVFVNTSAKGVSWGWKTLQLLKVEGKWKIASEFYTGHSG